MARNCTGPSPSVGAVVKLNSGLKPVACSIVVMGHVDKLSNDVALY